VVSISTAAPHTRALASRWRTILSRCIAWRSRRAGIAVHLCYGGGVAFATTVAHEAGYVRRTFRGLAVRPVSGAFGLRHSSDRRTSVRVQVVVRVPPATEAERIAETLWPPPPHVPAGWANVAEILVLRRTLVREP
jgi:hypothetical protein